MRLILASRSPRRADLLASAGFDFEVLPADVDETAYVGEAPEPYAIRIATAKARQVAGTAARAGDVVLGADTVVVSGGRMMGKPVDDADAAAMLEELSGAVHTVLTALVLIRDGRTVVDAVSTRVRFVSLTVDEIAWYIATGEPGGKAGGYAIQGRAARFIDWIDGSWSNVVGLPIAAVERLLKELTQAD